MTAPTKPGYYWWRRGPEDDWKMADITGQAPKYLYDRRSGLSLMNWDKSMGFECEWRPVLEPADGPEDNRFICECFVDDETASAMKDPDVLARCITDMLARRLAARIVELHPAATEHLDDEARTRHFIDLAIMRPEEYAAALEKVKHEAPQLEAQSREPITEGG